MACLHEAMCFEHEPIGFGSHLTSMLSGRLQADLRDMYAKSTDSRGLKGLGQELRIEGIPQLECKLYTTIWNMLACLQF